MATPIFAGLDRSMFETSNPAPYAEGAKRGVDEEVVHRISSEKGEPDWMLQHRLKCLNIYREQPLPNWGPDLSGLDLDDIIY